MVEAIVSKTRRNFCLALLLALLIGHASVVVHTATHFSGDAVDCELCNSYANATKGLPTEDVPDVPRLETERTAPPECGEFARCVLPHARQRAPPVVT